MELKETISVNLDSENWDHSLWVTATEIFHYNMARNWKKETLQWFALKLPVYLYNIKVFLQLVKKQIL